MDIENINVLINKEEEDVQPNGSVVNDEASHSLVAAG